MKYILILSIIAASLGSCAIVPAGYGDSRDRYYNNHDGYDRDRGYSRGGDNYRERNYSRGDGSYRDYSYASAPALESAAYVDTAPAAGILAYDAGIDRRIATLPQTANEQKQTAISHSGGRAGSLSCISRA